MEVEKILENGKETKRKIIRGMLNMSYKVQIIYI